MKFRILIVDDEDSGRQTLRILMERFFWAYIKHIEFAKAFEEAQDKIIKAEYDIIFLDINLKGISAFDLLRFIPAASRVVFVTAYSEFVLKALRSKAFDYLLKPVKEEELQLCLNRIVKEDAERSREAGIQIKAQGITRFIEFNDIIYVEGDGPYSHFHLKNDTIKTARTLKSIVPELNDAFVRIHKSFLLNRRYLKGFTSEKAILHNDAQLPVSRTGYKNLCNLF